MSVKTAQGSDGRALPAAQPEAGSVTGSPFSVTSGAAVTTTELTGLVFIHATQAIHVRFSKDGTAATSSNMLLPAGQLLSFPVDGDTLSMIASSTTATVYVETARNNA